MSVLQWTSPLLSLHVMVSGVGVRRPEGGGGGGGGGGELSFQWCWSGVVNKWRLEGNYLLLE